jgi:hypothetical protein
MNIFRAIKNYYLVGLCSLQAYIHTQKRVNKKTLRQIFELRIMLYFTYLSIPTALSIQCMFTLNSVLRYSTTKNYSCQFLLHFKQQNLYVSKYLSRNFFIILSLKIDRMINLAWLYLMIMKHCFGHICVVTVTYCVITFLTNFC